MHLFLPSKRRIFTIVSNEEYWLEPKINFCSCKGYYFKYMKIDEECHHLKALSLANKDNIDIIEFNDEEYNKFLLALLLDLTKYAMNLND